MSELQDALMGLVYFKQLPVQEIQRYASLWSPISLRPGEQLWTEGGLATELGAILHGELSVLSQGMEVTRLRSGELCGEASAFLRGATRSATVRAELPTEVAILPVKNLLRLRRDGARMYDALLRQALLSLVRRVRATDLRIASLSQGSQAAPVRREPGLLARMWRSVRPGGPTSACPPLEPLLRRMPVLRQAEPEVLTELATIFKPEPVEEGQILFLEGEQGGTAYLIAEGKVDVLRHVRGERAECLATLMAGDLFGANSLVERGPRTASCVVAEAGWLYRIDGADFNKPAAQAGLLWREAVLAAQCAQLRSANAALGRALSLGTPAHGSKVDLTALADNEASLRELLRASASLQSLPVDEITMEEEIQVVAGPRLPSTIRRG